MAVLREAIRNEVAGRQFYADAAHYCIDLWAKETFARLADDEEEHTRLLARVYQELAAGGDWLDLETARYGTLAPDLDSLDLAHESTKESLFSTRGSPADLIDRKSDDLAALALGIEMERRAIHLYGEQALTVDHPQAHAAYRLLMAEETEHRDRLQAHWERLAGTPFQRF